MGHQEDGLQHWQLALALLGFALLLLMLKPLIKLAKKAFTPAAGT